MSTKPALKSIPAAAPQPANDEQQLLHEAQAAELLQVKPGALKTWRHRKVGPRYVKLGTGGAIRYRRADVLAYIESRIVTTGDSE